MAGTKTNERPGTRARVSYVRSSAYKAREVLDQIRGKSYAEASEILDFSERDIAHDIKKVLDSAVANAEHSRWPRSSTSRPATPTRAPPSSAGDPGLEAEPPVSASAPATSR